MFPLPKSLEFLSYFARKSWPQLTKKQRNEWKSSIGRMKGFDERSKESLSRNITSAALRSIEEKRWRNNLAEQNMESSSFNVFSSLHEPTDNERKAAAAEQQAAIAECAVEAHRQGFLLLAIAPDLAPKKAAFVMKKEYCEHIRNHPEAVMPKRLRCPEWLKIIAAFEDDEARPEKSKTKSDTQLFARYRRAMDGIVFPKRFRQS